MKISIANKKLLSKPQSNIEKANFFKDITFKTGNISKDTFLKVIETGCTITYLYKDSEFNRSNSYMKNHYLGTQFICVDIDSCSINPIEFVERLKYKPTLLHTTFGNLTPQKQNKWCFHLFYIFDEVIKGEDNFRFVFDRVTEDYSDYVDNCAKDCHRVIFTSNKNLPNYICKDYGIIYKVKDFLSNTVVEEFVELDNFFNESSGVEKNKDAFILSSSSNNIEASSKNQTVKNSDKISRNDWNLDDEFFSDLNSMQRSDFISKYYTDRISSHTVITDEMIHYTDNGIVYADLRGVDWYEVPSKFRFNPTTGKSSISKVQNGNRTKSLMFDCLMFLKCNPTISKEELVVALINEVYKYYNNSDKELSNYKILGIAKYGWNLKDNIQVKPLKKKFKILVSDSMKKIMATGVINKLMKDEQIEENLDYTKTLEDNIKLMKENGIKITKNRLQQFLKDYEVTLKTDKQIRNEKVLELYLNNPSLSLREMVKLCSENGIKIEKDTISSIIKEFQSVGKNETASILNSTNNIEAFANFQTVPNYEENTTITSEFSNDSLTDYQSLDYRKSLMLSNSHFLN